MSQRQGTVRPGNRERLLGFQSGTSHLAVPHSLQIGCSVPELTCF